MANQQQTRRTVALHVLYRHLWLDFGTQLPGRQQAEEEDELQALTCAWCSKRLSNLDYLLHLNSLAGRRYGDPTFHPFLPWSVPLPPRAPPHQNASHPPCHADDFSECAATGTGASNQQG